MKRAAVVIALALVASACTSGDDGVRFESASTPTTTGAVAPEPTDPTTTSTTAVPAGATIAPEADMALDAYNVAIAAGDLDAAAGLLARDTIFFFDVVAALASSGERGDFDRAPILAGFFAGVLRGFDSAPTNGTEAFVLLAGLGQIPAAPAPDSIDWFEAEPGLLYGLAEGTAFVTMSREDGAWKVDLTQALILTEGRRRDELVAASGLDDATTSEMLFEPVGFVSDGPPLPRDGGAMSLLVAPAWGRFLRAIDSMEWLDAYGMLGSITRIDDTRGIPAVEIARRNALTGNESTFAGLAFADALLALAIRASYAPDEIPTVPGAEIFGLAMEAGVIRLSATSEDLTWQTTSGIRFLGRSPTEAAGVFRSGADWIVDGNVVAASSPSDFSATDGINSSDRIALLLAALNQITGGSYDVGILSPVG